MILFEVSEYSELSIEAYVLLYDVNFVAVLQ